MTDLADLVEAYKREVALPGTFTTAFPTITDEHIAAALGDAFGEAQMDGFFGSMELDTDGWTIAPDLSTAGAAVVIMYAGMRVVRQQIRAMKSAVTYEAGIVKYAIQQSASALGEDLKQLERRRNQVIANARRGAGTSVFMIEGYVARGRNNFYGGLFDYEIALPRWAD